MSPDTPPADLSLLTSLRARQLSSRTAQVARSLDEGAKSEGGAFNASAAAALNDWKKL